MAVARKAKTTTQELKQEQAMAPRMVKALQDKDYVVCQIVTGKHKGVTRALRHDDKILKGPYKPSSPAPDLVAYRNARFTAWGGKRGASTVPARCVRGVDGLRYLVMPRLGKLPTHTESKRFSRWVEGDDGVAEVATRGNNSVELISLVAARAPTLLPADAGWGAAVDLARRVVLRCGDTGLHNMLYVHEGPGGAQVWGIDYEDWRGGAKGSDEPWADDWLRLLVPRKQARAIEDAVVRPCLQAHLPRLVKWLRAQLAHAATTAVPPTEGEARRWRALMDKLEAV